MSTKTIFAENIAFSCAERARQNRSKSRNNENSTRPLSSRLTTSKGFLRCCMLVAILLTVPGFITGLKEVSVTIPQAVKRGSNALLICNYDMENDTLYSVKWYKGRREFYRYTPKENPAMKVFPMATGLNVERNLSNQSHVVLLAVPLNISGKFTCEISVEAPTFQTAMVSGELEVVELPEEQAVVTGIQSRYRIGDLVDGNCSIKYSKPAANLTWTINGIVVPPHHIKTYQIEKYEDNNLESVVSALHFMVTTQHFIKGQMRLKCTASIFDIFNEEIENVIEEDRPRIMASGRSHDIHSNYPYEQHSSGDGFEDHNESFLTYSAADITSSASTIHGTTVRICVSTLRMLWKYIRAGWVPMAAATFWVTARSDGKQHIAATFLAQPADKRFVKWISGTRNVEDGAAMKDAFPFAVAGEECVADIFVTIFVGIIASAVTRHFISCQKRYKRAAAAEGTLRPSTLPSIVTTPLAALNATVLLSKVTAVIRGTNDAAVTAMVVKPTLKVRKSFHNCAEKNLKALNMLLLMGLPRSLVMSLVLLRATMANPLQKLQLMKQRKQLHQRQHETSTIWQNGAPCQRTANQQLSVTVAIQYPSPVPAIPAAVAFDTLGVSRVMTGAVGVCNSNSNSNNQAIANFTKDTSKDQTLLMMIAQRFDCQPADDFFTTTLKVTQEQQNVHLQANKSKQATANDSTLIRQQKSVTISLRCSNC